MSHYVSSKPFYILTGIPSKNGFLYGANQVGNQIIAPDTYPLEEFDDESVFADRVDELIGIDGWYWWCQNRVSYPPNPNPWNPETDCTDGSSDS